MNNLKPIQKVGLALGVLSVVVGFGGTVYQVYASFETMRFNESAGIGAVGGALVYALLFSAVGIIGSIVGAVLIITGRSK